MWYLQLLFVYFYLLPLTVIIENHCRRIFICLIIIVLFFLFFNGSCCYWHCYILPILFLHACKGTLEVEFYILIFIILIPFIYLWFWFLELGYAFSDSEGVILKFIQLWLVKSQQNWCSILNLQILDTSVLSHLYFLVMGENANSLMRLSLFCGYRSFNTFNNIWELVTKLRPVSSR